MTKDEKEEIVNYVKRKYIAKSELASHDWKTQAARRFKNIPKGAEVKMIKKDFWNYYGKFSEVEWNGNIYYVDRDDIEEIVVLEKTNEKLKAKPKKYLTYDKVLKLKPKAYKVLLNGSEYKMELSQYDYGKEICFSKNGKVVLYRVLFDTIEPFFNDLHLELVEDIDE